MENNLSEQKQRLKKLRRILDKSPKEMGELLGLKEKSYYYYEVPGSAAFLDEKKIEALSEKTGVRKEWLLNNEEPVFEQGKEPHRVVALPLSPKPIEQTLELPVPPGATKITITLRWG